MPILLIFIVMFISCPIPPASADTILLKDGKKIEVDKAWEDNGWVKYSKYGSIVGYPKEKVERIDKNQKGKSSDVNDFKFDHWVLGAKFDHVMQIVKQGHIVLKKEVASEKTGPGTAEIVYEAKYLNKEATVTLFFTPRSEKLTYITVHWAQTYSTTIDFAPYVEAALTKKYGAPLQKDTESVFPKTLWALGERNQIILFQGINYIEVLYVDNRMHNLIREESKMPKTVTDSEAFDGLDKF